MTLSSMDGLTRMIEFHGGTYEQAFFADRRTFLLSDRGRRASLFRERDHEVDPLGAEGREISWNDVVRTAIASGAFPFAFPPVELVRYREEYAHPPLEFESGKTTRTFTYVDGGFFDNDPLHLAQDLARILDERSASESDIKISAQTDRSPTVQSRHEQGPGTGGAPPPFRSLAPDYRPLRDRRFIYLAPQVPISALEERERVEADSLRLGEEFVDPEADPVANWAERSEDGLAAAQSLGPYARRIVEMGLGTARGQGFRDYIGEHDRNADAVRGLAAEVRALSRKSTSAQEGERLLRGLAFMAESGVISSDLELLEKFVGYARSDVDQRGVTFWPQLESEVTRRVGTPADWVPGRADAEWLVDLPEEGGADAVWKQLFVQLFEIRGLAIPNNFLLITTTPRQDVVGGQFHAFGGFFNEKLRAFDFLLGRYYAQQALVQDLGVELAEPADSIRIGTLDSLREELGEIGTLASHFPSLRDRQEFRSDAEARLRAYVEHAGVPVLLRGLTYSSGNRWLDASIYHEPRHYLLRAMVGYDELNSLGIGAGIDVRRIVRWIPLIRNTRLAATSSAYDDLFRKSRRSWSQLFLVGEYGYWGPSGNHYLDAGGALQVHVRAGNWFAPRFTFEAGRRFRWERLNEIGPGLGYFQSIGVESGVFHLGIRTERSPSFTESRPTSLLRVGFSVVPRTTWKSLRAFF